jgi:hypothetical protein
LYWLEKHTINKNTVKSKGLTIDGGNAVDVDLPDTNCGSLRYIESYSKS